MKRLLLLLICLPLWACTPGVATLPTHPDQLQYAPLVFKVPEVDRQTLANGIRLYLKEDQELPLVSITAVLAGGSIGDPANKTGLANLYASLLRTGGAGDRSPADLDARLEYLAIDFGVSADPYAVTLNMSLRSADLAEGLAILADVLQRPRFAPDRLELARQQMIESIRRAKDSPSSVASQALGAALYPEHPLGRYPTNESVAALTRDDLLAFHRRFAAADQLWLALTGDFRTAQLQQTLNQLFGSWPAAGQTGQAIPPLVKAPQPRLLFETKAIPQTTILFGETGVTKDNPDLPALKVMNYILGGGGFNSRLMREVRSNRGLAYSVYSYYQTGRRLPGQFIAGAETKNESVAEVVELMRRLMQQIGAEPVSEAELALAKESLINSFVFAFDNTHDVVTQSLRLDFYDYPPDYLKTYRDKIAAVTAADVQRVAKQYLHPDQQVLVLVGDPPEPAALAQALGLKLEAIKDAP
jgi:zinc protease